MAVGGSIGPSFNPNAFGQANLQSGPGGQTGTGFGGMYSGDSQTPISSFGAPSNYSAAATTQASDYDTIMKNYGNVVNNASQNPITPSPISPQSIQSPQPNQAAQVAAPGQVSSQNVSSQNINAQQAPYQQSSDVTGSLADLSNLTQTGGYTAQGKADILARDIAPTRGIYANAQQNMQQQRALGGGYSPNFNAATAQLSRDSANQIASTDTAANAGIAQNVAANQIAAGGQYAGAAAGANAETEQANLANANIVNQVNEANANRGLQAGEFSAGQGLQAQETNVGNTMQANQQNANAINQINEANAQRGLQTSEQNQNVNMQGQQFNSSQALQAAQANRQAELQATQGMASLYGTTPALTSTFGNQVMQAGQLGQGQQALNLQSQRQIFGAAGGY